MFQPHRTLGERFYSHYYAMEMLLPSGKRWTAWVKRLPRALIRRAVKRAGLSKRCDAVDWGLLDREDSVTYTIELRIYTKLPSTGIGKLLVECFCSEAIGKGEFFSGMKTGL